MNTDGVSYQLKDLQKSGFLNGWKNLEKKNREKSDLERKE
jgi:hypothetical protein